MCSAFVFNDTNNPVVTSNIYRTVCTIDIRGSPDGIGLSKASIVCTGADTPVAFVGSEDLNPFSDSFEVRVCSRTCPYIVVAC